MKKTRFIPLLFTTIIILGCCKEYPPPPKSLDIIDGVIIRQEPLWRVPHDTANIAMALIKPYWKFDDKVIVDTYKGGKAGIRCMEIESGRILWEQYFQGGLHPNGLTKISAVDYVFNPKEGYLIMSLGNIISYDTEHVKLNIHNGDILWRIPIDAFGSMAAYGDHYYCTVLTPEHYNAVYRVDIGTGEAEFYYVSDLPGHGYDPEIRVWVKPFEHQEQELLFIPLLQITGPMQGNHYFDLMVAETHERILTHVPLDDRIIRVDVHNEEVYLFTGSGYKVFDMETLSVQKEFRLLSSGDYVYHTFYKDKLIVGLTGSDSQSTNGHFVVNLSSHRLQFMIEDWVYPSSILNDVLYYVSTGRYFRAYNLNTGDKLLDINLRHKIQFGVATHQNGQGDKFVVVGDRGYTYCFEGI